SSFFFSRRRRHTRFSRDWSSDVCSSDLSASSRWPWLVRTDGGARTTWSARRDHLVAARRWGFLWSALDAEERREAGDDLDEVGQIGRAPCRARGGPAGAAVRPAASTDGV